MYKYILNGFIFKTIASFDDVVTRIPIIAHFAKTKKGRIAFAFGNLLAATIAIILARIFVEIIKDLPNVHIMAAVLIMILAIVVYFDLFSKKEEKKIKEKEHKIIKDVVEANFFKLMSIGFIVSLITLLDDFIVLSPLFLASFINQAAAIVGVYLSTLIQLVLMIYFGKKLAGIKNIKEIAAIGLFILAILVYFKVL